MHKNKFVMSHSALEPLPIDYVVTIIITILALIITILSLLLTKCICCPSSSTEKQQDNDEAEQLTSSHYCSIITVLFYNLVGIFTVIAFINILLTYHNTESGISYIFTRCCIFSWQCGMFSMLCTFSFRVRLSFRDSFLQLSKRQSKGIAVMCILIAIIGACVVLTILLKEYWLRDILAGIDEVLFIILSIILMVLFIKRIDRIMFAKYQEFGHKPININNKCEIIEIKIEHDLVNLIVKHGVLVSVAIISTFLGVIGTIVIPKANNDGRYPIFSYLAIVACSMIASFSIYLSFAFSEGCYWKLCCYLHYCCKRWKISQIEKKFSMDQMQRVVAKKSILLQVHPNSNIVVDNEYIEMQNDDTIQ